MENKLVKPPPRYPYDYRVIGYNFPTYHYLYTQDNNPDQYILKQTFAFPFEDIVAEEYILKIILPEGAKDINYDLPFEVDEVTIGQDFSYLDFFGRPTITFKMNKIMEEHNRQLYVKRLL